ncbi:MAG: DUF2145 domain-containing protein [Alphaproteobacteria bacterium]|nr:DUF2145 domain-containing protein [Alphaproteobacteria bacterium]
MALSLFAGLPAAEAGSNGRPVDNFTLQETADFSKQIERELAHRGAYVAMVFRSGRPRSGLPDGIRYTHGAFWVYTPVPTLDGGTQYGYAVFNLYHEISPVTVSGLYQDWPLDFTRGDAIGQVGVIIPNEEMQERILDVIASPLFETLHNPDYSLLSNPGDARYQNCNEFMLDVVASSIWQTTSREQIKVNLDAYFSPSRVHLNVFERWVGPLIDQRLRLDDHTGDIRTTTYASMADFMLAFDLADQEDVFEIDAPYFIGERSTPGFSDSVAAE